MNIRNRLKKLENEVIDDSPVCVCFPQFAETYMRDLGENSNGNELVLISEAVPDLCPNCRKIVEKNKIIVRICDQTTKDRFPEEWQSIREKPQAITLTDFSLYPANALPTDKPS
jgi:hypothetical protein